MTFILTRVREGRRICGIQLCMSAYTHMFACSIYKASAQRTWSTTDQAQFLQLCQHSLTTEGNRRNTSISRSAIAPVQISNYQIMVGHVRPYTHGSAHTYAHTCLAAARTRHPHVCPIRFRLIPLSQKHSFVISRAGQCLNSG